MTTAPERPPPARASITRSGAGWSEGGGAGRASADGGDDDLAVDADDRYLDLELAGAGGMGTVMVARDRRLGREVAVKRVAVAGDDDAAHRRLAREARITARLEHPGIVPIYDAGLGPDGRSYYAMRLIRGRSLAEVLAAAPALEQRLPLVRSFLAVCQAIAHAHRARIVHLDLKPTNVMIGELGEALVVDWGLARALDDEPAPAAARDASPAGTPAYLSPGRARGLPGDLADDVWALGAILVEILAGHRLLSGSADDALRALRGPPPPPRGWPERCPPELAAIADKALAWDAGDRYPDAGALARDVAAYLDGRRVGAHAYSTLELARRLLRAWRWQLAAAAAAIVAAIVVLAVSRGRIAGERERAVAAERRAQDALVETRAALTRALDRSAVAALLAGDLAAAESYAAAALRHGESVDARGVLAATRAGDRPAAARRHELPGCDDVVPDDERHALCLTPGELQGWAIGDDRPRWRRALATRAAVGLGGRWAIALDGGAALVLDGATGEQLRRIPMPSTYEALHRDRAGGRVVIHNRHHLYIVDPAAAEGAAVRYVDSLCEGERTVDAIAVGGERTYAVCSDGRVWSVAADGARAPIARIDLPAERPACAAALDADERTLAVGTIDGHLRLLDLARATAGPAIDALDERVAQIAIVGDAVAVVGERGGARVWTRALDRELLRLPERAGRRLAVAGDALVTGGAGWWRWSLAPRPRPRRFAAPAGLSSAAVSPDGALVAAARGDGRVSVWSTATGAAVATPALSDRVVKRLDFDAGGGRLAVGISGKQPTVLLDTASWRPVATVGRDEGATRVAFLRGDELIGVHYDGALIRWRAGVVDEVPAGGYIDADRGAGRDALWLLSAAGAIDRYRDGALAAVAQAPGAQAITATRDGGLLAIALGDVVLLRALAGGPPASLTGAGEELIDVAVSPDDVWLAASTTAGTIDVWSLADRRWVAHLRGHTQRVAWVGFAAGALWSASWDGSVLRWDLGALAATPDALAADAAATWALP